MMKTILCGFLILSCFVIFFADGCAKQENPKAVVVRFLRAVRGSDAGDIEKTLFFERLIEQKDRDAYMKLPADKKDETLERFKNSMLKQLTVGNLRSLGDIEPQIEKEDSSVDNAEVIVADSKKGKRYQFLLAKEGGVWKIYSIAGQ